MTWQLKNSYTTLPAVFYSYVSENKVKEPSWLIKNEQLASKLGLSFNGVLPLLAGNDFPDDLEVIAQSYAGHQFGHFTMLGDGRAVLLGEIQADNQLYDVQLKGSGRTPYSRGGDGRAAVGPMLREYIISEAMHALGIPTTRSLAVVKTGEKVQRECQLEGAILTRIASSHLRVGTFEFAAQFTDDIKELADYAIERHYKELNNEPNKYERFLEKVVDQQAQLIAKWQLVGFVHGVMNTDNMTISGETIDYGPCAFIDEYNLNTVFSSIDTAGRYAFGNQPNIALWNLTRLAECLLPLFSVDEEEAVEVAKSILNMYSERFYEYFFKGMLQKLGLSEWKEQDENLVKKILNLMEESEADYTNSWRALSEGRTLDWMEGNEAFKTWRAEWLARIEEEGIAMEDVMKKMRVTNPAVIPRNYYVDEAIRYAERGDLSKFDILLHALQHPFELEEAYAYLATPPKDERPFVTYCGT